MKAVSRAAQATLSTARVISAVFYCSLAIVLIGIALWIAAPRGESLFLDAIALLVGVKGAAFGVKGLELFLSAHPVEQPAARQERLPPSRRN